MTEIKKKCPCFSIKVKVTDTKTKANKRTIAKPVKPPSSTTGMLSDPSPGPCRETSPYHLYNDEIPLI